MIKYPAPALERGLYILSILDHEGEKSLAELTAYSKLPKASVSRYLETLVLMKYVRKDSETNKFHSLCSIERKLLGLDSLRGRLPKIMKEIVDQTGLTAEWYELEGDNAVIRNRVEPTNVSVKVVAQAGFVRVLNYEFDAVAKLFLAYHELPSPLPKFIRRNWDEIIPLSAETVRNELEKVKKDFVTDDKYFNHNGVRRCAMAIFDSQENFLGVLALTGHYHPSSNKVQRRGIELLKRYYKELKHVL